MNENYVHPPMPENVEEDIIKGMYKLHQSESKNDRRVQLLGSGTILREIQAAAEILENEYATSCDIWSVTSFNELAREGRAIERHKRLNPLTGNKVSHVEKCLSDTEGPIIAATDYMQSYADQIREFVPRRYCSLGTDGFGRSDTRAKLREFFEVNRNFIAYSALSSLMAEQKVDILELERAAKELEIDTQKPDPTTQ